MKLPNYAKIDLSSGKVSTFPISEKLFYNYLGGKILGSKLLLDLLPKEIHPLSPESILIINTSPANGTGAPSSSRFNLSFKNVLTGGIASSNCGGQFGVMLKKSGYDGLIITGKSPIPCYIEILDEKITIKDASQYMGMDAEVVQSQFDKCWGKLVIGQAGENKVNFACAVSGERVAGRCGAGAVMGSKNLKLLVAYGTKKAYVHDEEKLTAHMKKWTKFLKSHPMTGDTLPKYGSAGLVSGVNASSALPTRNFQKGHYKKVEDISGETFAEEYLVKNSGCISCPIRCERRVIVNNKEVKGPEFETVGLLGSNIDNNNFEFIKEINYYADIWGLDSISLSGTIAFAMELQEKGLADFGLEFGKVENIKDVVWKISIRDGIYSELANGCKWLSEKYGGTEFAIHSKGLELASYEPRSSVGMGLGYATSNRGGCHLNGGYIALMESAGVLSVSKYSSKGKAELTILFQNMLEAVSAAGFCLFTSQASIPSIFLKLGPLHPVTRLGNKIMVSIRYILRIVLKNTPIFLPFNSMHLSGHCEAIKYITGIPMTAGKFMKIGERGYNTERLFNLREGLTAKDDSLPNRITKVPQDKNNPSSVVKLDEMLPIYYKVRGWDKNGVPTKKTKKRLGV